MTGQEALDKIGEKIRKGEFATMTREELDEIQEAVCPTPELTEEMINEFTTRK